MDIKSSSAYLQAIYGRSSSGFNLTALHARFRTDDISDRGWYAAGAKKPWSLDKNDVQSHESARS